MSDFGKFVGGLMIGGMIGGILGIMLAPHSGAETRQKIADNTNEQIKKAEESAKELQKKTEKAIEELQKSGQEVLRKVANGLEPKQQEECCTAEQTSEGETEEQQPVS